MAVLFVEKPQAFGISGEAALSYEGTKGAEGTEGAVPTYAWREREGCTA